MDGSRGLVAETQFQREISKTAHKNMELGKEMFKFLIMSEKPSPINIPLHPRINQEEARLFVCNARSSEGRLVKLLA